MDIDPLLLTPENLAGHLRAGRGPAMQVERTVGRPQDIAVALELEAAREGEGHADMKH